MVEEDICECGHGEMYHPIGILTGKRNRCYYGDCDCKELRPKKSV